MTTVGGTAAWDGLQGVMAAIAERERLHPDVYPQESIKALYDAGVIAAPFRPELGGDSWSLVDSVKAIEAIASVSASTALITSMPLGLAGIHGLGADVAPAAHRGAWSDQIDRVAADFKQGRLYAACNSEKGAGGSLAATKTVARRASDGAFHLTGEKILATSGSHAATFFSTAKVSAEDLPGAGIVEFFFVETSAPGVTVMADWDGFGMRSTESQTVRYEDARAREVMGFPGFIETVQALPYFHCLFAAIPLGCAKSVLQAMGSPAPSSPALRLRLADAVMRYEAMRAYLLETAARFAPAAGPEYAARVVRTKTYVAQESTKLCAELFALSGGRHYRRTSPVAGALADSFAGTALRPPLALSLDMLVDTFSLGDAQGQRT